MHFKTLEYLPFAEIDADTSDRLDLGTFLLHHRRMGMSLPTRSTFSMYHETYR